MAGAVVIGIQQPRSPAEAAPNDVTPAAELLSNANFVNDLAFDSIRQVMWAATSGGVVRWSLDGRAYRKYTILDDLPANNVMSVAVNRNTGDVWFGTWSAGAVRLDAAGNWLRPEEGPRVLAEDITVDESTGDVWFASGAKLYWLSANGRWHVFEAPGLAHEVVLDEVTGDVWAATSKGAARIARTGEMTTVTTADGLPHDVVLTTAVDTATGRVWFGTREGVAFRDSTGAIRAVPEIVGKPVGNVDTLAVVGGRLWLSCDGGLFVREADGTWRDLGERFARTVVTAVAAPASGGAAWLAMQRGAGIVVEARFGQWDTLVTDDTLPGGYVLWLDFDEQGEVWLGDDGLVVGHNSVYAYPTPRGNGLFGRRPGRGWDRLWGGSQYSCTADTRPPLFDPRRQGHWFGTGCGGVGFVSENHTVTMHTFDAGPPMGNEVYGIALDPRSEDVWAASDGGARHLSPDGRWRTLKTADGLPDDNVLAVAIDDGGDVWFGTPKGASRLTAGGRWVRFDKPGGLSGDQVRQIVPDKANGDVWLATDGGASRIDGSGAITSYSEFNGLGLGGVSRIVVDAHRSCVWLLPGTPAPFGLGRIDATGHLTRLQPVDKDTRLSVRVNDVRLDGKSHELWLATSDGIYRLDARDQWTSYLRGRVITEVAIHPGTQDLWFVVPGGVGRIPRALVLPLAPVYLPSLRRDG